MNGPTIQQVKAAEESLWHFLSALPQTHEAQQLYALMIAGMVGMIAHYLMKWAQGEIVGNLGRYLFCDHVRATALSFFTYIGFALATVIAGALDGSSWFTILWLGVTTGFSVDALTNKGIRPKWTEEQRAVKAENPTAPSAVLPAIKGDDTK